MKNNRIRFLMLCVSFAFASASLNAQNDTLSAAAGDRYVISATAGGVNFIEGTVSVLRKEGKSGYLLKGDTLKIGDKVSTGSDGKAEILLNPGSFLRVGGNSTFEFKTTSLDDLQVKVDSGSAIFEVFAAEDFLVAIHTPKAKYVLIETGVYRVDVTNGSARLEVWKGLARVPGTTEVVGTGRVAASSGSGSVLVSKFDRDEKDALDIWSKARSKELAKLTAMLKRGNLRTALMRSFLGRRWNMYDSFGLWVYEPLYGGHCFLPFGHHWNSPYGHGYGNYIGWYNLPPAVYYSPHSTDIGGGTGGPAGGAPTAGGTTVGDTNHSTPRVKAADPSPVPPFIKMQQSMGDWTPAGWSNQGGGSSDSGSHSSPSYSPSSSSSSSSSSTKSDSPPPTKSDPPPPTKQP